MNSRTTTKFWRLYDKLPKEIKAQAKKNYKLFREDPTHPGLFFKKVHPQQPIFSIRISKDYRAIGIKDANNIIWFWIGSHSDYDKLLQSKN